MYISPKREFRPAPPSTRKDKWSRRFQYLYFLRFCLVGWLLLPVLCVLDGCTGVSALSRGIMTLSTGWQAFHTTFFVVTLTTTTLVCARNIVMNGNFRFDSQPPVRLYEWMTECGTRTLWTVLAVTQIPAFITLWYVTRTTIREQVGFTGSDAGTWPYTGWHLSLWGWYAGGLVAAFVFWYLVTLFYLWTHEWIPGDGPRALIFPNLLTRVEEAMQGAGKPQSAEWLESALRWPLRFTHTGYAPNSAGPLWELHFLATVSLIAFVLLYLFLYPIVAPVVTTTRPAAEIVFAAAICICVLLGARRTGSRWKMEKAGVFFSSLFLALLGCFVYLLISDIIHQNVRLERSFPVLASVTVILIFMQWGINGASFFFDRYRVPVLTSAVAFIFLPKLALSYVPAAHGASWIEWVQTHIVDWEADHYFEVRQAPPVTVLPTPTEAVNRTFERLNAEDHPLVVVTATGGGIQAAEWTAQVMARLEKEFREDKQKQLNGYLLHDHLLLASGVSGGSVGLVPYLAEYTAPQGTAFPANDDLRDRLTIGPGCSSLEAVAWGLEYYDLQRLALTFRFPILQSAQDSPDDRTTIVAPDRTWALSRAVNRNLNDPQCGMSPSMPKVPDGEQITLGQAAKNLSDGTMPAFTLNTTVAESGGRFLLSNYMVPAVTTLPRNTEFLPAESFLQAYAQDPCCANGPHGEKLFADLPLSTAARMSATFPVVSSATRIPRQYARAASHFLDGGYFDNDGTGSAIEFLYSVMDKRVVDKRRAEADHKAVPTTKPLKLLLVEIRDGDDLDPYFEPDDLRHQSGGNRPPAAWWLLDQLLGPLEGLWNAGHVSVTRRNRRELCVLETAYRDKLIIHHVVFAIPQQPDGKQEMKPAPLSWKLTASQLAYISSVAHGERSTATDKAVNDSLGWVAKAETSTPSAEVCNVANAPTE
jgi:Patatin-like phospholipase